MLPVVIYTIVYFFLVVVIGFENGGWNDFYHFTDYVPVYVSFPVMILLALGISIGILYASNLSLTARIKSLTALWTDEVEPLEVKIEMFGLGRYVGEMEGDSEIPIPMDIIGMLSDRYGMKIEDLLLPYTKGVSDAFMEKKGRI